MPNFAIMKQKAGQRQDGFRPSESFPIKDFTAEEAEEYGQLMKDTFIEHWKSKQNQ